MPAGIIVFGMMWSELHLEFQIHGVVYPIECGWKSFTFTDLLCFSSSYFLKIEGLKDKNLSYLHMIFDTQWYHSKLVFFPTPPLNSMDSLSGNGCYFSCCRSSYIPPIQLNVEEWMLLFLWTKVSRWWLEYNRL